MSEWLQEAVPKALREFRDHSLRVSYLIVGGLIVCGVLVNWLLASHHGWTVWPLVAAAGIMLYMHEAAARNGEGVPQLHAYALFAGIVLVWVVASAFLSIFNPFIVFVGIGVMGFFCLRAILKDMGVKQEIDRRRAEGRCVHCGELADVSTNYCESCGQEPDPDAEQLKRIMAVARNSARSGNARAALKQDGLAGAARKKEAALMARSAMRKQSGQQGGRR